MAAFAHQDSNLFRPTTLDSALDLIANLRSSIVATQEGLARSKDIAEHIESGDFRDEIDTLVRVRSAIKAGRIDDALYDLEKVISTFDSGYLCRS